MTKTPLNQELISYKEKTNNFRYVRRPYDEGREIVLKFKLILQQEVKIVQYRPTDGTMVALEYVGSELKWEDVPVVEE